MPAQLLGLHRGAVRVAQLVRAALQLVVRRERHQQLLLLVRRGVVGRALLALGEFALGELALLQLAVGRGREFFSHVLRRNRRQPRYCIRQAM